MPIPQYQFNLGNPNVGDPLLNTYNINEEAYASQIDNQIEQLKSLRQQFNKGQQHPQNLNQNVVQKQNTIWEEIDKEILSLDDNQKQILAADNTYIAIEQELQMMIQAELINSVKYKVGNTPRGKELLDNQLKTIKDKKAKIIEESNKEIELFKKFQIAVQANPQLTYPEFIKSIKQ